jgi:alpha-ketoglutarate-dependent taurine dioxygenase
MLRVLEPVAGRNFALISPGREGDSLLSVDETLIKNLYMDHGALLFSGFACDLSIFYEMTSRFCSSYVWNESRGPKVMTLDKRIQTVNVGTSHFPLHAELARQPWKPDVAWFACVNPPSRGGETLICDGIGIVDNMPSVTRKALQDRRLLYKRIAQPTECQFWFDTTAPSDEMIAKPPDNCPFSFTKESGGIYCSFTHPVLHKPLFSNKRAFANFLLFSRFAKGFRDYPLFEDGTEIPDNICNEIGQISDKILVPVTWQRNDLFMLDNTRFMHGRNAIVNAEERVILTNFGFLNFAKPSEEDPIDPPWRSSIRSECFLKSIAPL